MVFLIACGGGESPPAVVGKMCDLGASPNEIAVAQPNATCGGQACMHITSSTPDMCTVPCETEDDCIEDPASVCQAGFVCAPVLSVGAFACKDFCVCADRVPATSCP